MSISLEQIKHLAHLSRLEFSEEELKEMQGDMGKILEFVAQIDALDLEGVEPLTQMSESTDVMRDDQAQGMLPKEEALKNAFLGTFFHCTLATVVLSYPARAGLQLPKIRPQRSRTRIMLRPMPQTRTPTRPACATR
jgi:aspartyl-tRNA(Asn)/glutamyl-tRNA(Gln) amidotransferase subunit C